MIIYYWFETTTDRKTILYGYEEGNSNTGEIKVLIVKEVNNA